MLRLSFIINGILITLILCIAAGAASIIDTSKKAPIVITSQTLTADSKNNTAIFEGSVVAKSGDIEMYSDRMTVFYNNEESKVRKIHAMGNVKVHTKEKALFAEEATYFNAEDKIIFTGNPRAVDGENVISGSQIIFYLNDDRAVVEKSRVILNNVKSVK